MKIITITSVLFLHFLSITICSGQVETYYVKPIEIDTNYSSTEDSSTISRNTDIQLNKLFLFIGGTGSSSSTAYNALRLHAANLGFDFINLSYPNSVPAASLSNSTDSLAFNKYRQEICFGTPNSNAVSVDTFNSIYTRTLKLIQYLDMTNPSENWGQYLITPNSIDWSKIIIGGHSQGAGHAAYFGKQFLLDRVLMFSGPNDYSDFFSNSANWLRQPGVTPIDNHFAYLSLNDEIVDFSKQFENLSGLEMLTNDDSTYVDNISAPYGGSNFLYTTQPPGLALINHSVPIKLSFINSEVWTYMLTSPIITSIDDFEKDLDISIFPNPTTSFFNIKFAQILKDKKYTLRNISGQTIRSEVISEVSQFTIDLSDSVKGIYFFTIDNSTYKIIKH